MNPSMDTKYQGLRSAALARLAWTEALDRPSLQAYQLASLGEQVRYCFERSPFYRAWRDLGLPDRFVGFADLARFPFTTKDDLRRHYPFGFLAVPPHELIRYGESTGTTGDPTSSFITYEDWIQGNVWVERALQERFSPDDLVFVAIPYELTFASYDIDRALEQLGVTVVAVGTLNQICPFERLIAMMRTLHPTALVCTPTRALRLFDMLVERGHDPLEVGLRRLLYVGETCSRAKLKKIADLWRIELVTAYGSTETNSLALPCGKGEAHLAEDRYLFEVIDPDSGEVLGAEETGELVLSSLRTRAMPLLRYRTGDLVAIEEGTCACGSSRRTLRHQGRVGERIETGGVSLPKIHLEEVLLSSPGTGLYYVAGEREGVLKVHVEIAEIAGADPAEVCREAGRRLREAFGIPASVQPVSRAVVTGAMDRMLKPGSLDLDDLEAVLEGPA
jgi:phenylacetate-CoA ligase